ncbi:MAG: hypothetical protein HY763_01970 [Planctomycetes bacterium]|nr:hypothetical protein [Planctomycetota bacterium]
METQQTATCTSLPVRIVDAVEGWYLDWFEVVWSNGDRRKGAYSATWGRHANAEPLGEVLVRLRAEADAGGDPCLRGAIDSDLGKLLNEFKSLRTECRKKQTHWTRRAFGRVPGTPSQAFTQLFQARTAGQVTTVCTNERYLRPQAIAVKFVTKKGEEITDAARIAELLKANAPRAPIRRSSRRRRSGGRHVDIARSAQDDRHVVAAVSVTNDADLNQRLLAAFGGVHGMLRVASDSARCAKCRSAWREIVPAHLSLNRLRIDGRVQYEHGLFRETFECQWLGMLISILEVDWGSCLEFAANGILAALSTRRIRAGIQIDQEVVLPVLKAGKVILPDLAGALAAILDEHGTWLRELGCLEDALPLGALARQFLNITPVGVPVARQVRNAQHAAIECLSLEHRDQASEWFDRARVLTPSLDYRYAGTNEHICRIHDSVWGDDLDRAREVQLQCEREFGSWENLAKTRVGDPLPWHSYRCLLEQLLYGAEIERARGDPRRAEYFEEQAKRLMKATGCVPMATFRRRAARDRRLHIAPILEVAWRRTRDEEIKALGEAATEIYRLANRFSKGLC